MALPPDGPIVYLLGNRTSHADFEKFARGHDWLIHEDRPSKGPKRPDEQIWLTRDRGTAIHYMDDPTPKERFLVVYGRDTGTVAIQIGTSHGLVARRTDCPLARESHEPGRLRAIRRRT